MINLYACAVKTRFALSRTHDPTHPHPFHSPRTFITDDRCSAQHREGFSAGVALHRRQPDPLLPAERKEAAVLLATGASLRALQLQKRQGLPVAEQDDYFGCRLCQQRDLQLYYSVEGTFQVQD